MPRSTQRPRHDGVRAGRAAPLRAAIALLDAADPTIRPISGGAALMLMMQAGVFQPTRLVSLGATSERFSDIAATPAGGHSFTNSQALTPGRCRHRLPRPPRLPQAMGAAADGCP